MFHTGRDVSAMLDQIVQNNSQTNVNGVNGIAKKVYKTLSKIIAHTYPNIRTAETRGVIISPDARHK